MILFFKLLPWFAMPALLYALRKQMVGLVQDDKISREQIGVNECNTTPVWIHIASFVTLVLAICFTIFDGLLVVALLMDQ